MAGFWLSGLNWSILAKWLKRVTEEDTEKAQHLVNMIDTSEFKETLR